MGKGADQTVSDLIAEELEITMAQLAVAWVLQNPNVACAIIGASRPRQIRENAPARAGACRLFAVVMAGIAMASAAWAQTPPAGDALPGTAAAASGVTLHPRAVPDGVELYAHNALAGPVEVLLTTAGPAPRTEPPLPVRATIPAYGRVPIARLADGVAASAVQLRVVPGAPDARARDVEYLYPLRGAPRCLKP